jgi:lactate/malate dehydrogenase, NAD binding domain
LSGTCSQGYAGDDQLAEALKGADVVIMPAGVPRKPGMTRDDLFKVRCCQRLLASNCQVSAQEPPAEGV